MRIFRLAGLGALLAALCLCGCGRKAEAPAVPTVALQAAEPARQEAFAKAVVKALKAIEDLDVPAIKISLKKGPDGRFDLQVRGVGFDRPKPVEDAVSLAVTNIALRYPGVGFAAVDEFVWKIKLPDTLQIPVTGPFDFGVLGNFE